MSDDSLVYPSHPCDGCWKKVSIGPDGKPQDYAIYYRGYEYGEPVYVCADCLIEDMNDEQIAALKKAIEKREEENGLRSPE